LFGRGRADWLEELMRQLQGQRERQGAVFSPRALSALGSGFSYTGVPATGSSAGGSPGGAGSSWPSFFSSFLGR
jgi:hypothetical protein